MNSAIDFYGDIVQALLCMMVGITTLIMVITATQDPITPGMDDKTIIQSEYVHELPQIRDSEGIPQVYLTNKTGMDLVMALYLADEYTPEPKSIRLNETPIVDMSQIIYSKGSSINTLWGSEYYRYIDFYQKPIYDITYVIDTANGDYYKFYIK